MKPFLCLSLLLVLPAFCRADDLTVTASPDWQPIPAAQSAAIRSRITQKSVRLVDASEYAGGGRALTIAQVLPGKIDKPSADQVLAGFVHGIENSGAQVTDRQPARIGPLPGISVLIAGQNGGRSFTGVGYAVFTDHEMYAASIYGPAGISRTDPRVTSYLARLKVSPAAVPGGLNRPADLDAYHLGYRFGQGLCWAVVLSALFLLIRGIRRRSSPPPPLPPN